MASYYVPLPAQRVDNPLLDFSPINQGLNGIAQVRQQNTENAMARERMAIAKDQHQYQRQRDVVQDARQAKQDARIDKKWHGEQAMAIMRMPEGSPERAAAWQRHLKQFNAANLSPEELDPMTGPKLYAAEAGLSVDPMEQELKQLSLQSKRADLEMMPIERRYKEAQTRALGQKDAMNEAIAEMLRGSMPGQQPGGGAELLRQQSFDAGPEADPRLIQTAGDQPQQQQPRQEMVQTPLGPMTADRARQLGMALALGGKGDAGRMFTESVDRSMLGKEGRNEVDKRVINTGEGVARLMSVRERFRPEFLNIDKRLGFEWNAMKEKWLGGNAKLTPQQTAELEAYTGWKADALDNVNQYIKEITGAAMTEAEAKRILAGMPNPGQGLLDGDSPTQFKAKLDAAIQRLIMANARFTYAQKSGRAWSSIGLSEMQGVIQKKTDELQGQFQRQGLQGDQLRSAVKQGLKQEFGI